MSRESNSKKTNQDHATGKKEARGHSSPRHSSHTSPISRTPGPKRSNRESASSSLKTGETKHRDVKPSSEKKATQSSTSSRASNLGKAPEQSDEYIPVRVVLQKGYPAYDNEHDNLLNKLQKESRPHPTSSLLTASRMMTGKVKDKQASTQEKEAKEIEMDFMNVLNINVAGSYFRTLVKTYFGNRQSISCNMVVDTGSPLTWVNKRICSNAAALGRNLGFMVTVNYGAGDEEVMGELYENMISFGSANTVIERQVFIVVDETDQPDVRNLRVKFGIVGVLGLEVNASIVQGLRPHIPSVAHQLLLKKNPAFIFALDFNVPLEPDDGTVEGSRVALGELHFGGFKRSAFDANGLTWITPISIKLGSHERPALNMGMTCKVKDKGKGKEEPPAKYPAIISSGLSFICIPPDLLYDYVSKTGEQIFHYDSQLKAHYLFREEFPKLKDAVFNFDGVDLTFPPQAQVIPSRVVQQWEPQALKDCLYLVFRNSNMTADSKPVILLGHSFITRYYIIMDAITKKVGIAEAKHKTHRVWKELREFFPRSEW